MARPKKNIPKYGTVPMNGVIYFRTRIEDADGKRVALYALTAEELYEKVEEAKRQIKEAVLRRNTPTVKEYCEKWLKMHSANIRFTTLTDYQSKVKNYIIKPLGHMYMADVSTDDGKLAMVPASKKSASVYRSVQMLYKVIFTSAVDSNIITISPCEKLNAKGGVPQKERDALTDEQGTKLLAAIKGLPPYAFVMLGLYAGLRREEILGYNGTVYSLTKKPPISQYAEHGILSIIARLFLLNSRPRRQDEISLYLHNLHNVYVMQRHHQNQIMLLQTAMADRSHILSLRESGST
jgi:hypothetical protein